MMAPRLIRSGAVTYKWLVLRHLADIKSCPSKMIERMRTGGWVSALQDGKGVTLGCDKFHERTASKDIQLILPKRLTEKNTQVLCQYVTYGASARRNLIHQSFSVKEGNGFVKTKDCTPSWSGIEEKYINIFWQMISTRRSFNVEFRILTQPFTKIVAKDGEQLQILGRFNHEEDWKNLGEDLVKVISRPCFVRNCIMLHRKESHCRKKFLFCSHQKRGKRFRNNMLQQRKKKAYLTS